MAVPPPVVDLLDGQHTNGLGDSTSRPARGAGCAPPPARTGPTVIIRSVGQHLMGNTDLDTLRIYTQLTATSTANTPAPS
jgi:hypothetical protein